MMGVENEACVFPRGPRIFFEKCVRTPHVAVDNDRLVIGEDEPEIRQPLAFDIDVYTRGNLAV
jgi:hypothetical protein